MDHAHAVQTRCMAVRVHRHCVEYVLCGGVQVGAEKKVHQALPRKRVSSLMVDPWHNLAE